MTVLLREEFSLNQFKNAYREHQGVPCNSIFQKVPPLFSKLGLDQPLEMHNDTVYDISRCISSGTGIPLSPQACSRLRSLANEYQRETNSVFQSISVATSIQNVKGDLERLKAVHLRFLTAYADEFYQSSQPEQANSTTPKTCDLFLNVFLNNYDLLSSSITDDPQFWIRLPALTIEMLLINQERHAPEVFSKQADRIYKMSFTYRDLSESEKLKLHQELLGHHVDLKPVTQELFKSIYLSQEQLELSSLRGPQHFLYRESERAAKLFGGVTGPTSTRKDAVRAMVRWFLDDDSVKKSDLPLPFQQEQVMDQLTHMKRTFDETELDALCQQMAEDTKLAPWLNTLKVKSEKVS